MQTLTDIEKVESLLGIRSYKLDWLTFEQPGLKTYRANYETCMIYVYEYPERVTWKIDCHCGKKGSNGNHGPTLKHALERIDETLRGWKW